MKENSMNMICRSSPTGGGGGGGNGSSNRGPVGPTSNNGDFVGGNEELGPSTGCGGPQRTHALTNSGNSYHPYRR